MIRISNWRYLVRRYPQILAVPFLFVIGFLLLSAVVAPPTSKPKTVQYAHQQTYARYNNQSSVYKIAVIADKDKSSKNTKDSTWDSELKIGSLNRIQNGNTVSYEIEWEEDFYPVTSKLNEEGRGMELSDLIYWNNKLLSFDDRTGIVYEIVPEKKAAIARHVLVDGNGKSTSKGFKCEWSTVKDDLLYVGSLGKEWTNADGAIISQDPQYIKTISLEGRVDHISWVPVYQALRKAAGYLEPGYLIHEAVRFNPVSRRWFFLPRRASHEAYNDVDDEKRGANLMITTDEFFEDIKVTHVGPQIATHGFSSFVFVPHRENEIVAIKTSEFEGNIETFITVFTTDGTILLEETKIGDVKYEGVEVIV